MRQGDGPLAALVRFLGFEPRSAAIAETDFGAIGVGDIVWTISDIGNALMAIPNIILVLLLSGEIARATKHYLYDGNLDERFDEEIPVVQSK